MSWLSSIFKGNKKRDTTYTGPQPPSSLMNVTGGRDYYDTVMKRLGGQGVGYGEQYADQVSSPIIARMRNQFQSYDIPELQSQLTAQGRRKSSGGFDQLRRAYTDQSLAEGDVYANLYRENEAQKRNEINRALEQLGQFNQNEYDVARGYAADQYGKHQDNLAIADKQRAEGNQAFQNLIQTGAGLAYTFMPQSSVFSRLLPSQGQSYVSQNYAPTPYKTNSSSPYYQRLRIK